MLLAAGSLRPGASSFFSWRGQPCVRTALLHLTLRQAAEAQSIRRRRHRPPPGRCLSLPFRAYMLWRRQMRCLRAQEGHGLAALAAGEGETVPTIFDVVQASP